MKSLIPAINKKFASDRGQDSFYAAVGGQLFLGRAPQRDAQFPFAVMSIIGITHGAVFTPKDLDSARVQFSVFSDTPGPKQAVTTGDKVKALFDDAALTFDDSDFATVQCWRDAEGLEPPEDENGVWHYHVDYLIKTQEL